MEMSKVFAATALCGIVLASTGCGIKVVYKNNVDCHLEPYHCRSVNQMQKGDASPFAALEVEAFDPAQLSIDVSESNVEFVSREVPYAVSTMRNGAVVATAGFTAVRSGAGYVPADPVAVKAWLMRNAIGATTIVIDVRGMRYVDGPGANLVSLRALYDGMELSGTTTSWYRGDQREIQ